MEIQNVHALATHTNIITLWGTFWQLTFTRKDKKERVKRIRLTERNGIRKKWKKIVKQDTSRVEKVNEDNTPHATK